MLKRTLDVTGSSLGMILLWPLWLLICLAIAIEDGAPFIFRQQRLGLFKQPFEVIKFRTMTNRKVTRVGRWLRATGLDETLQLLMVLKGDMSLVGPRPLTAADIERIGWHRESCQDRWEIKPGITGLAQLYSGRGARLSLHLDRYYRTHHSFRLDLKIIVLSALVNLFGKKRVQSWLLHRHQSAAPARARYRRSMSGNGSLSMAASNARRRL